GALLSGEATTLRALDPEEVDTIESQLVVENRKTLVPASLGLPGCPLGAVATATLWASLNAADLPPSLPSGVSAELLSRELLGADEATKERIVGAHVAARARSQEVKDLLAEIVGATEHLDARPVVLGELLDLLDGTLPDYFTDVEHLDLLLPVSKFDEFVSALESIGLVREAVSLTTASLESGLSVVLRSGGDRPITVQLYRTLASGPFGVLVDPREFHTLAVPVRIGRSWCAGLHPAHRFIHACLRLDAAARDDLGLARSAVTNTPRTDSLCNEMLEMAERWGATTTVLSIVAHLDKSLPGIPTYLASVASGRTEMSRRTRRIGRRSR
ncbi:MAG TPA: hypothetical protein VL068_00070, partial [Microthrixaceae bacterium]|nr:hypothetical protein [Microthrixaceae bacterium]